MGQTTGDYAYWKNVDGKVDRRSYTTGPQMKNVIFPANGDRPADIEPIGPYKGRMFAFYWFKEGKDDHAQWEYSELREKGYEFATTDKFKVNRDSFRIEGDKIYWTSHVLMAIPAEQYDRNKEEERNRNNTMRMLDREDASVNRVTEGTAFQPFSSQPGKKAPFSKK